ncbi:hypothetical protein [Clostridium sp. Cult2]|uniref:hypothetical protein n=1 Tax=Clostridium sp. Cult2 TaxID=2079003 RepID=UPI001F1D9BDD|nr:hypothetical protein [Clostridium sp. Cult2]MCF6464335.1 hypothetical protein [Clostridium sp. Cult2]
MYPQDYNQRHPAVPPLYPMDPCRPRPMPYNEEPMPMEPYMPNMPYMHCPMMDPRFRDCIMVCMMQCGNYPMYPEYPMNMDYGAANYNYPPAHPINMDESVIYYPEEMK